MRALVTEFIGTFFLVLAVGLSTNLDAALAPLAIGGTLMIMVYAGANASGGHYNPAVSLAAALSGALPRNRLAPYWGAQIAGAVVAGLMTWKFTGSPPTVEPAAATSMLKAVTGEAIATFALAYVVLHTATGKGRAGNSYFGLAIGGTVAFMAIAFGPITGGAFNPAVGLGPAVAHAIVGSGFYAGSWMYVVGPLLGGAIAAQVFKYQES